MSVYEIRERHRNYTIKTVKLFVHDYIATFPLEGISFHNNVIYFNPENNN